MQEPRQRRVGRAVAALLVTALCSLPLLPRPAALRGVPLAWLQVRAVALPSAHRHTVMTRRPMAPTLRCPQGAPVFSRAPCAAAAAQSDAHGAECAALVALAEATGPVTRWAESEGWLLEGVPHCSWHGVTCDGVSGHVTAVQLDLNALVGTLPAALGALATLRTLSLRHNALSGSLPAELGRLSRLQRLCVPAQRLVARAARTARRSQAPAALTVERAPRAFVAPLFRRAAR